jgi:hypothetical protein
MTKKTKITKAVQEEADRLGIPKDKIDFYIKEKSEADAKLTQEVEDLLQSFRAELACAITSHETLSPRAVQEFLDSQSLEVRKVLIMIMAMMSPIFNPGFKAIFLETLKMGLDICQHYSVQRDVLYDQVVKSKTFH